MSAQSFEVGHEHFYRLKGGRSAGASYGITPGAPSDIERIESGLLSYGADARYGVNPFEAGLGAFVGLDRDDDFVGKAALQTIMQEGVRRRRTGLVISGDKISGFTHPHGIYLGEDVVGTVTEAVYSPRLEKNIAVAILNSEIADNEQGLEADIGEERRPATVSRLPFCCRCKLS